MREVIVGRVVSRAQGFWRVDEPYEHLDLVYYRGNLYRGRDVEGGIPAGTPLSNVVYWEVVYRGANSVAFEDWDPTKDYYVGDMVIYERNVYECIKDAPAGTAINNTEYWNLITLDDESNSILWWDQYRSYVKGALVMYQSVIYRAVTYVPPGIEITNETYWEEVYNPATDTLLIWRYDRSYKAGDKVLYRGTDIYEAKQDVPANQIQITNEDYWDPIYRPYVDNLLIWSFYKSYFAGTTVIHEGNHYKALKDVPSGKIQITDRQYWEIVYENSVDGTIMSHDPNRRYSAGDMVLSGNAVYAAKIDVPADNNIQVSNDTYWDFQYYVGSSLKVWDINVPYSKGDQVVVNGIIYEALQDVPGNGSTLISNTAFWMPLGDFDDFLLIWKKTKRYQAGINVVHEGRIYLSIQEVPPNTEITNTDYWQFQTTSSSGTLLFWEIERAYVSGDVVIHDGVIYRAVIDVPPYTAITDENYWELEFTPKPTLVVWDFDDEYLAGIRVYYRGAIYQSKQPVPARTARIDDDIYWAKVDEGTILWWRNDRSYEKGDQVIYFGNIYECLRYAPIGTDINDDGGVNGPYWLLLYTEANKLYNWTIARDWQTGDEVLWRGSIYRAIQDVPASANIDITNRDYWEVEFQARGEFEVWDETKLYKEDDQVFYNGDIYRCVNDIPDDLPPGVYIQLENELYWVKIYTNINLEEYDPLKGYSEGKVVIYENEIWKALQYVPPGTYPTVGAYWQRILVSTLDDLLEVLSELEEIRGELDRVDSFAKQVDQRTLDLTNIEASLNRTNAILITAYRNWKIAGEAGQSQMGFAYARRDMNQIKTSMTTQAEEIAHLFAAQRDSIASIEEYNRAAVGYCVTAEGNATYDVSPFECLANGGAWVDGPLAEQIKNIQILTADGQQASFQSIGQAMQTLDGGVVARGALISKVGNKISGYINTNDGTESNVDFIADNFRIGIQDPNGNYSPLLDLDNQKRILRIKAQLVLGDGYELNEQDDIKGQKGDTIWTEFRFSYTGKPEDQYWHFPEREGDNYMRSRLVTERADGTVTYGDWGERVHIAGKTGYTWIVYAEDNQGTNLGQAPTGDRKFIGLAHNRSVPENGWEGDPVNDPGGPLNPTTYNWSRLSGDEKWTEFQFSSDGSNWHFPELDGDKFMRTREVINGTASLWGQQIKLTGQDGADGSSTYTWIVYGEDNQGTNLGQAPTGDRKFIGIAYNKKWPENGWPGGDPVNDPGGPLNPGTYVWSRIMGDEKYIEFEFSKDGLNWHFPDQNGDLYMRSRSLLNGVAGPWGTQVEIAGKDGKSAFTWIVYAEDVAGTNLGQAPTGNRKFIGIAYNRPVPEGGWDGDPVNDPGGPLNPRTYQWSRLNGQEKYTEFQFSVDGSTNWHFPDQSNDAYMRTRLVVDGTPQAWGQTTKIAGEDGADGESLYTWVKYAVDSSGNGINNVPSEDRIFMGIAYNQTEPENNVSIGAPGYDASHPSWQRWRYTWNRMKGADGKDSAERYTWIKYARDGSGNGIWNTPADGRKFIGIAYNRPEPENEANPGSTGHDPNHPSWDRTKYNWTRIYGDDGKGMETMIKFHSSNNVDHAHFAPQRPTDRFMWVNQRVLKPDGTSELVYNWSDIEGIEIIGQKGDNSYTWIRYASDAYGANLGTSPAGRDFVAIVSKNTPDNPSDSSHASNQASTYSGKWRRFVGPQGDKGEVGAGFYTFFRNNGVFPSDAQATADFKSILGRNPGRDDHVTYRKSASSTISETKRYSGSSWVAPALMINGDLLAMGSITGDRLVAGTSIASPVINSGKMNSGHVYGALVEGSTIIGGALGIGPAVASNGYPIVVGGSTQYYRTVITPDGKIRSKDGEFAGTVFADKIQGDVVTVGTYGFGPTDGNRTGRNYERGNFYSRAREGEEKYILSLRIPSAKYDRTLTMEGFFWAISQGSSVPRFKQTRLRVRRGKGTTGTLVYESPPYYHDQTGMDDDDDGPISVVADYPRSVPVAHRDPTFTIPANNSVAAGTMETFSFCCLLADQIGGDNVIFTVYPSAATVSTKMRLQWTRRGNTNESKFTLFKKSGNVVNDTTLP